MAGLDDLIGESQAIRAVAEAGRRLVTRLRSPSRLPPVLIEGETGTGKGVLARALHEASPRARAPFVQLNCAAIPASLFEAELFGFERGAFTGATAGKPGLLQLAQGGTLFLDEIALLPLDVQPKLLTAVEEHELRRLGGVRPLPFDVWIVAATNADVAAAVRAAAFREDLYHRLAAFTLRLPPLRERGRDVLLLAEHFLARACADYGLPPRTLEADAAARLLRYPWPGNVRELANVIERVVLQWDSPRVTAAMVELAFPSPSSGPAPAEPAGANGGAAGQFRESLHDYERAHVRAALEAEGGNITRAAEALGVHRNTLRYRIARLGLGSATRARPPGRRPRATGGAAPPPTAGAGDGSPRPASPLVGREGDMAQLGEALQRAAGGRGQVVGITGDMGIGKSRLVRELCRLARARRVAVLEGHCTPLDGDTPWSAIADLLRRHGEIPPDVVDAHTRCLLARLVDGPDTGHAAMLTPEATREHTVEAFRRLVLGLARRGPVLLVIEDLHWVDPTSNEALSAVAGSLGGYPVLLVATYRTGHQPPGLDRSYASQLSLRPLLAAESLALVAAVRPSLDLSLATAIAQRAQGVPFFVEELAHAVDPSRPFGPSGLPATVRNAITARTERLPAASRRLLEIAAVLGGEAPVALVRSLAAEPDTDNALAVLRQLGLLERRAESRGDRLAFSHTLVQEAIYAGLADGDRQALHAAAAAALADDVGDGRPETPERLAHHFQGAGQPAHAVAALARGASRAARNGAHAEALAMLGRAAPLVEQLPLAERPRWRVDLALRAGRSLFYTGRVGQMLERVRRHEADVDRVGDRRLLGVYHLFLARGHGMLGDEEEAHTHGERALADALSAGDEATAAGALGELTRGAVARGRLREALRLGREAQGRLAATGERRWLGVATATLATVHLLLGEFETARDAATRTITVGELIGDRRLQSAGTAWRGVIDAASGEPAAAVEGCQHAVALAPDPFATALATGLLGYTHLLAHDAAAAVEQLGRALRTLDPYRPRHLQAWFTILLGEALAGTGAAAAAAMVAEGLRQARERGYAYLEALGQRTTGRLGMASGDLVTATADLEIAATAFEAIGARHELGRTQLDLALVYHARGEHARGARWLATARRVFEAERLPAYVERAARLARERGLAIEA